MRSSASITSRWLPSMSNDHARGVEGLLRRIGGRRARALEPVVCHGHAGAAQRIHVGDARRGGMDRRLHGGGLFQRSHRASRPLRVPARQVVGVGQALEEVGDVRVVLGVGDQDGVVDVPARLPPGIEDDLLPGVVRGAAWRPRARRGRRTAPGSRQPVCANSKPCAAVKNGSYWRTGLPLLLKMVQPLPTQRGSTSGPPSTSGPGSAWIFFWISRPNPSE